MKDNLGGGLAKDRAGLGGLCDVSVHVGCEPWGIRAPRPPPMWRRAGRALVVAMEQWEDTCKISIGRPA